MSLTLPTSEELNTRVRLHLWSDVPNREFGVDQQEDIGRCCAAKVESIYGLAIRADVNTGEQPTHLVWIRRTPDTRPEKITGNHVIEWNGRRYRVLDAIDAADQRRFTRLRVKDLGALG